MIICCSMVLGTACEKNRYSDIDESHEEELVISDTAVRYEFPSDNILQYHIFSIQSINQRKRLTL